MGQRGHRSQGVGSGYQSGDLFVPDPNLAAGTEVQTLTAGMAARPRSRLSAGFAPGKYLPLWLLGSSENENQTAADAGGGLLLSLARRSRVPHRGLGHHLQSAPPRGGARPPPALFAGLPDPNIVPPSPRTL